MDDISQALAAAVQFHQAGNLPEAERLCRAVLARQPAHPAALDLLGFVAFQTGRSSEAIELLSQAVALSPANANYYNRLGIAYVKAGDPQKAEANFRAALRLNARHAQAALNLANLHRDLGRADEAAAGYQHALRIDPRYTKAWIALGDIHNVQGRAEDALAAYQQAVLIEPNHADAQFRLGSLLEALGHPVEAIAALQATLRLNRDHVDAYRKLGYALLACNRLDDAHECFCRVIALRPDDYAAHVNLGSVLQAQQKNAEAAASFRRALELQPNSPEALNNLGAILLGQGQLDEAIAALQRAIELDPKLADAHANLGCVLLQQCRFDEAIECNRRALEVDSRFAPAYFNIGSAFHFKRQLDEALVNYDEVIRLMPDYAEAHHKRASVLLSNGDFAAGWADYEWRLRLRDYRGVKLREPLWDGSALDGRTLLVHTEQGLGDTLQFIRYVALARQRGGEVLALVPHVLIPLLTASGYENLIASGVTVLPKFDVQAPLLSLPRILGTTLETIPNQVPYLAADPQLVAHWRQRLAAFDGFKIGIAWQGNPKYSFDRYRSIPLADFQPLAEVPGVRLVSLQKGLGTEQIAAAAEQVPLVDLAADLDGDTGTFMDSAAVMKNLDLVITPDTASGHLAGGLGVPVWLAICCYPEWRWMNDRDDSPWYPTMRLFRQEKPNEWADVMSRIAAALVPLAARRQADARR